MKAYRKALIVGLIILNLFFAACEHAPVPEPQTDRPKDPISSSGQSSAEQEEFLESIDDLLSGQDSEAPAEEKEPTPAPEPSPAPAPETESTPEPETESTPEPAPTPNSESTPAPTPDSKPDLAAALPLITTARYDVYDINSRHGHTENYTAIEKFFSKISAAIDSVSISSTPTKIDPAVTFSCYKGNDDPFLILTLTRDYYIIIQYTDENSYFYHISQSTFEEIEAITPSPDYLGYRAKIPTPKASDFTYANKPKTGFKLDQQKAEVLLQTIKDVCAAGRAQQGMPMETIRHSASVKLSNGEGSSSYFQIYLHGILAQAKFLEWKTPTDSQIVAITKDQYDEINYLIYKLDSKT